MLAAVLFTIGAVGAARAPQHARDVHVRRADAQRGEPHVRVVRQGAQRHRRPGRSCSSRSWSPRPRSRSASRSSWRSSGAVAARPPTTSTCCGSGDRRERRATSSISSGSSPRCPLLGAVGAAALRQAHRRAARGLDRDRPDGARVRLVGRDVLRAARPAGRGARQRRHACSRGSRPAGSQVDIGFLADPLSVTWILFVTGVGSLIHLYSIGYMHGDPRYSPVLRVPEPVRGLDARARPRVELPRDLPRLGGRRPLLVPARLVLVRAQLGRGRGQEGVRHQPRRRLRVHARDVPDLRVVRLARLRRDRRGRADHLGGHRDRDRAAAARSARSARARRSRSTSGCPTRWRARRRSRRSSTRPRW